MCTIKASIIECRSINPWSNEIAATDNKLTLNQHYYPHSINTRLTVFIAGRVSTEQYMSTNTLWWVCQNKLTLIWLSTKVMLIYCWPSTDRNVDWGVTWVWIEGWSRIPIDKWTNERTNNNNRTLYCALLSKGRYWSKYNEGLNIK